MAVLPLDLELHLPSEDIPRAHPCGALVEDSGRDCGATPALLHRRVCPHRHVRDVWLCGVHEAIASRTAGASCRDCAGLGLRSPVALVKVPEALDLLRGGRVPLLS